MDEEAALQVYEWGFGHGWDIELREDLGSGPRFVLTAGNVRFHIDIATKPWVCVA